MFCNTATQTVICREFETPAFTTRDEAGCLVVETDAVRLQYDQRPFSRTGLQAMLKGAFSDYASIWHYGDEPSTLKGTARTLDEADGAHAGRGGRRDPAGRGPDVPKGLCGA